MVSVCFVDLMIVVVVAVVVVQKFSEYPTGHPSSFVTTLGR